MNEIDKAAKHAAACRKVLNAYEREGYSGAMVDSAKFNWLDARDALMDLYPKDRDPWKVSAWANEQILNWV